MTEGAMTPEQYMAYYSKHAPRVIEFVRNAEKPIWMLDIIDGLAPVIRIGDGYPWEKRMQRERERDRLRSLIWAMVGPKHAEEGPWPLKLNNDLSVEMYDDDADSS